MAGIARPQQFGIVFSHQRVVPYADPGREGGTATPPSSGTACTHLPLGGGPRPRPGPRPGWAAKSKAAMPDEVGRVMETIIASGSESTDHRRAIRDRPRQIRNPLGSVAMGATGWWSPG